MAGKQHTLCAEVSPGERKVGYVDTPVFRFFVDVSFEAEMISATFVACREAIVVCPFVFIGDTTANLKERGSNKESLLDDDMERPSSDMGGHRIRDAMSARGKEAEVPLSKKNQVHRRTIGVRVKRDIHYRSCQ
jgi:hypothetical protein